MTAADDMILRYWRRQHPEMFGGDPVLEPTVEELGGFRNFPVHPDDVGSLNGFNQRTLPDYPEWYRNEMRAATMEAVDTHRRSWLPPPEPPVIVEGP